MALANKRPFKYSRNASEEPKKKTTTGSGLKTDDSFVNSLED